MKTLTDNKFIINRKNVLYEQRYTMARLARDIGVSSAAVGLAITGKTQSLKMHRTICNKLGMTLIEFWPELYGDQLTEPAENIEHHDIGALSTRC